MTKTVGDLRSVSIAQLVQAADEDLRAGISVTGRVWPTGFSPLDFHLNGGLRQGDLTLLGGPQALGKTTFALQMARNMVTQDPSAHAVYFCYEHAPQQVLERLLALEAGLFAGLDAVTLSDIREQMNGSIDGGLLDADVDPSFAHAVASVGDYGARLHVVRAKGGRTGLPEITDLVRRHAADRPVVFVDYLQKVAVPGVHDEAERVTSVVEGLKELSLEHEVPVVAIVAADKTGVGPGRTRIHHLRGSTALMYEADVVLMLNNKWQIVSRHHLMYGAVDAERFRDFVVCTVEKNRNGRADIDMQFQAHFAQSHLDPAGMPVSEQLIDDRVVQE